MEPSPGTRRARAHTGTRQPVAASLDALRRCPRAARQTPSATPACNGCNADMQRVADELPARVGRRGDPLRPS